MNFSPHLTGNPGARRRVALFGGAILFIGSMLVAFAQTFYFKPFFPETDPITILVAIHGAVMTGWAVLFAAQSALIIAGRPNLHRRLGIFGLGWAAAVVVMGTVMTVHAAARDVRSHDEHAAITIQILALELAQMALFAGFVTFGYMLRQRPGFHRRLMTFTLACMLPSLIARLPIGAHSTLAILLWTDAVVLAIIALDVLKNRSLHPGLMAGAIAYFAALHAAFVAGTAHWWVAFTTAFLS